MERLTDDLAYDDQATLSPDGNRIAFVTTRAEGKANLWILDLKTRQATPCFGRRYESLRSANNLQSDELKIGQTLTIPGTELAAKE